MAWERNLVIASAVVSDMSVLAVDNKSYIFFLFVGGLFKLRFFGHSMAPKVLNNLRGTLRTHGRYVLYSRAENASGRPAGGTTFRLAHIE